MSGPIKLTDVERDGNNVVLVLKNGRGNIDLCVPYTAQVAQQLLLAIADVLQEIDGVARRVQLPNGTRVEVIGEASGQPDEDQHLGPTGHVTRVLGIDHCVAFEDGGSWFPLTRLEVLG
ncbi:hypothetical protein D3875_03800 [Deinococcus cavernae]|uniref:Uncharacterized protein n=1 Tax=Deinococcus cavernae TaxID=2320857 RepID=A0A418VE75_9DEIO|nr:hypothetical protein [Deinococcus cavernae]RJF74412.1 hypothetical protein D3875_03800 [Deinococcus cavernae]